VPENQDDMIERIVDELKALPPVPADATARVLARVDAARRGEGPSANVIDDDDVIFFPASTEEMRTAQGAVAATERPSAAASGARIPGGFRRRFVVSLPAAVGYALAATLAGFLVRGALPRAASDSARQTLGPPTLTKVAVSRRDLQEAPVTVQFVLDDRRATSVSVVGDFNAWDAAAAPLVRDSVSGVWSALVGVSPGRHVYAFLVNGREWTLDPRALRAKDADYGTEQSVMIVGLP
jgi:hypothetical protein